MATRQIPHILLPLVLSHIDVAPSFNETPQYRRNLLITCALVCRSWAHESLPLLWRTLRLIQYVKLPHVYVSDSEEEEIEELEGGDPSSAQVVASSPKRSATHHGHSKPRLHTLVRQTEGMLAVLGFYEDGSSDPNSARQRTWIDYASFIRELHISISFPGKAPKQSVVRRVWRFAGIVEWLLSGRVETSSDGSVVRVEGSIRKVTLKIHGMYNGTSMLVVDQFDRIMLALCRSTPPPELARLYSISKAPRAAAVDECLRKVDLVISDACDPRRLEFMVRCLALGAINKHQSGLPFSRAQRLNELGELRIISWDRHSPAVPSFALRSILAVAFRSGLKRFILAGQSCVFLLDNPEDNDLFKPLVSGGIRRIHSESQQTEDSSSSSGTHSDSDFDWYSSMPVDLGQQNYALEHLELTRVTVVLPTTPPMGSDTKVSIVPPEIVAARQLHYTTTPLTPKDILRDRMKVHWPHLKTLILPNQKYILDDFLQAACETLQRLEHLELQSNVHLTGSGIVSGGSVLTCSSGHVRSALSDFASNSTALAPPTPISWPRLKHLNMDSCINLDPQFVSAVGRSCPQLEHLSLRGCALLQDWALEDILEWCKSLSHLDVSMCPGLTDGFLMRVCSAPTSPAGAVSTTMDTPRRFLTYLNVLHCNKILGQSKRDDDDDDDGFNDPARLLIQLALACPNLDQLSLNPHTHPSIKVCQAFEWRGWNSPQHQGNTAPPAAPPPPPPPPPQHAMRIPPADPQPQDPRSMLMRALNISRDLVEREEEQREKSVRVVTVSLERVRQGWKAMVRRECEMRGVGLREDEREGLEREMVGRVAWPGLLEFLSETT